LLHHNGLANRSQLFHVTFRSNLSSRGLADRSRLFRPPFRNNRNNRGRAWPSLLRLLFQRGSPCQRRRCRGGHRNHRPFRSCVRVLQSQRSRRLQTFGHAPRNRRSRQRKLRHRGSQKRLKSKSQRSASSLNFGRLLRRVRVWIRATSRVPLGMQALNQLLKSLSLLAMHR
jgi:hypothetical protein